MAFRFRRAFYKLVPRWLSRDDYERVLYSIGVVIDATNERLRQGLVARFPQLTETPDSLVKLGRDRLINRGLSETDAAYAARLVQYRYPKGHRVRGNPFALMTQIRALFAAIGQVRCRTVDARGNWYTIDYDGTESYAWDVGDWDWDGVAASPRWGRFWLIIYLDQIAPPAVPKLGDPDLWGTGLLGEPGAVLGTFPGVITSAAVSAARLILRDWKPAGTLPNHIILTEDPDAFDPGVTNETDGTWGYWANRDPAHEYIPYV